MKNGAHLRSFNSARGTGYNQTGKKDSDSESDQEITTRGFCGNLKTIFCSFKLENQNDLIKNFFKKNKKISKIAMKDEIGQDIDFEILF